MRARLLALTLSAISFAAFAQTPPAGYPADYAQTISAANKEGKVVIYSALDTKAAQPLVRISRRSIRTSRSSTTT